MQTLFINIFMTLFAIQYHSWTALEWIRQTLMRLYNQLSVLYIEYTKIYFRYQFPSKIGLNLFKESRRTSPLRVRRRLRLYIYPRRPEIMVGRDREWRAYRQVCSQRGRNLTMTMAISPIKCFPRQLLE